MRHRRLGRTALQVSELCLGTMNFGPNTNEADSFDLLDHALDHDIDFIDTADQYGGSLGVGATERSSATGWRRAATDASGSCSPRSCTSRCRTGRTTEVCRLATSGWPAMPACAGCKPTTSTCIRCTTSTGRRPGTRSGRRWRPSSRRGRSPTSGRATSPGGPSRRPTKRAASRHFLGLVSEQSLYNLVERTSSSR